MANQNSTAKAAEISAELASAPVDDIPALVERYEDDPRSQVRKACERAMRRLEKELAERERVDAMYRAMREYGGGGVVIGVDEVGRGSVAGPLTVCAVCLPDEPRISGLNDSKQLSPARRELVAARIAEVALAIGIANIPAADIDHWGMATCLRRAVAAAVEDAGIVPDSVLMDGNPLGAVPNEVDIVHGDARVACIAAASIVAKVTRDAHMVELDALFPGYHFAESKGYASADHIAAIKAHGLTEEHRVSFCGNFLESGRLF